jgi:protein-disulfide isomerase
MAKKTKEPKEPSRAAQMRAEREAAARRSERRTRALIAGAVVVGLGIVGAAVITANQSGSNADAAVPAGVTAPDGGAPVGQSSAPVVVDEWLDFQCPACKSFHDQVSGTVDELVEAGDIQIVYHPLSFVVPDASERAANAFGCAIDQGQTAAYHDALLENQGAETGGGYTNEQLIGLGEGIGLGEDFAQCVEDGTYDGWVSNVEAAALEQDPPVTGTPTFFMNGEPVDLVDLTPESFEAAVEAAASAS